MRLADVSVLGGVSISLVESQNSALSRVTEGLEKLSPRPKHPPGPLHVVPGSGLFGFVDQFLTALGLTLLGTEIAKFYSSFPHIHGRSFNLIRNIWRHDVD